MYGTEQPGQDEDLEENVGLDDKGAEDEEDLVEEIEIVDQVQSEMADGDQVKADAENATSVPDEEVAPGGEIPGLRRSMRILWMGSDSYAIVCDRKSQQTRQGPTVIAFIH